MEKIIKNTVKKFIIDNKRRNFYELMNHLKDINNVSENDIDDIIYHIGFEGFNNAEDASEYLSDKINEYKNFPQIVTLYRVIGVKNKKYIKRKNLGNHYTPYRWNIDGSLLLSIGFENWDSDLEPYVAVIETPKENIDFVGTIITNLKFPNEHEVTLFNNAKNLKIKEIEKLYK